MQNNRGSRGVGWEGEGGKSILTSPSRYFYTKSHASSKDSHRLPVESCSFISGWWRQHTQISQKWFLYLLQAKLKHLAQMQLIFDPDLMKAQTYAIGIWDTLREKCRQSNLLRQMNGFWQMGCEPGSERALREAGERPGCEGSEFLCHSQISALLHQQTRGVGDKGWTEAWTGCRRCVDTQEGPRVSWGVRETSQGSRWMRRLERRLRSHGKGKCWIDRWSQENNRRWVGGRWG